MKLFRKVIEYFRQRRVKLARLRWPVSPLVNETQFEVGNIMDDDMVHTERFDWMVLFLEAANFILMAVLFWCVWSLQDAVNQLQKLEIKRQLEKIQKIVDEAWKSYFLNSLKKAQWQLKIWLRCLGAKSHGSTIIHEGQSLWFRGSQVILFVLTQWSWSTYFASLQRSKDQVLWQSRGTKQARNHQEVIANVCNS